MNGLRPLFDDLAKETRIINEALQPFPSMAGTAAFYPRFFCERPEICSTK